MAYVQHIRFGAGYDVQQTVKLTGTVIHRDAQHEVAAGVGHAMLHHSGNQVSVHVAAAKPKSTEGMTMQQRNGR